jgi:hypothetical protein
MCHISVGDFNEERYQRSRKLSAQGQAPFDFKYDQRRKERAQLKGANDTDGEGKMSHHQFYTDADVECRC